MPVIIMVVVLGIGTVVMIIYRKNSSRAAALATSFGFNDLNSGQTYESQVDGTHFFYKYYAGSKNNPSYFKIWITCPSRGAFRIGRETALDRLFKNLGITVELQTGDSRFDRDYFINTDAVAFTSTCFSSSERRRAVNELFKLNFKKISHDGNILEIKITPFTFSENFDKATVEAAVKQLEALGRNMPEDYYERRVAGTPAWKLQRNIIYTVSITSVVLGVVALILGNVSYPPMDPFDIFKDSLKHSIPALLIFIALSVYMLKGRSSSHVDLLVNLCISLIGIPLLVYSGMVSGNGYLDKTPAVYHAVRTAGKRYSKSKNTTTYYVLLESWRDSHATEEINVNKRSYDQVHSGMTFMGITTRMGYLGYEWLVAYKIAPDK